MDTESLELVHLCLCGDEDAWIELVEAYRGLVYGICRLSNITDQEADDLAQEAFIRIWMTISNYDPKRGGLKSWIASLTRNLRIDRYRRNWRQRLTDSIDQVWDDTGVTPAVGSATLLQSPHDTAFSNEVVEIIKQAVNEISPQMRDAVIMRVLQDLDDNEIVSRLGIPVGTVKSRVHRGRAQLEHC